MTQLLYSALKLSFIRKDPLHGNIEGGVGTGFYWLHEGVVYLVTNWHNVTGINPVTEQSISTTGLIPTHVIVPVVLKTSPRNGQEMAERKRFEIALYNDEQPSWLEHPKFGNLVDVVAIKIALMDQELISLPMNAIPDFVDFQPDIGDDVFVIGYPMGLDGGKELAIWKRGSIASSPFMDLDDLPKLLIDTATRKGMSGSPVVVRRKGIIHPRDESVASSGISDRTIIGEADTFLGVYSGRLGNDEMGIQLGIVWKSTVIKEIISGRRRGRSGNL
jgi:hypothetical protein